VTKLELIQLDCDSGQPLVLTRRECLVYGGMASLSALQLISICAPAEAEPSGASVPPPSESGFRRIYLDK
jgi:hypothetical protein